MASLFDLFSPEQRADPYPGYARLRETAPVWEAAPGYLVLSRHHDCAAVLRDGRFGHAEWDADADRPDPPARGSSPPARGSSPPARGSSPPARGPSPPARGPSPPVRSFLLMNPPDHTRLRRQVSKTFTPSRVEALEPRIVRLADELIGDFPDSGVVDVVEALAARLPVGVISELLGIPPEDRPQLVEWSHALARSIDPAFLLSDAELRGHALARQSFGAYLVELAARRRRAPGDDLLSALVTSDDRNGALSEQELVATCILLLVAGHETTTSLIGTGLLALLRHQDQLRRLVQEPQLVAGAVEELLRFDSPVQLTARAALEDAAVGGVAAPEGTVALLLIGAANRDPEAHHTPDRLDVGRPAAAHLAFGQGVHFCLGAPLARLEAQVALRALVARFDRLELAGEPTWKDNVILRGVQHLDVFVRRTGVSGAPVGPGTLESRGAEPGRVET